jgi:hypothetical protein
MVVPTRPGLSVEGELPDDRHRDERRGSCEQLPTGETCFSHD